MFASYVYNIWPIDVPRTELVQKVSVLEDVQQHVPKLFVRCILLTQVDQFQVTPGYATRAKPSKPLRRVISLEKIVEKFWGDALWCCGNLAFWRGPLLSSMAFLNSIRIRSIRPTASCGHLNLVSRDW